MEKEVLRKVQLKQLEIAKEVKRVCELHNIRYFLTAGTLIGAVRHQGFIPWDDDLDIGMLREDYIKFCEVAPNELKDRFVFQNWYNTPDYSLPFGKVRLKGTRYIEGKSTALKENGIYIDILLYDYLPCTEKEKRRIEKLVHIERILLVQTGYKPWFNDGKTNIKKRLGYFPYSFLSKLISRKYLIQRYEKIAINSSESKIVYGQTGEKKLYYFDDEWFKSTIQMKFENDSFDVMQGYDSYLTTTYGDYMKLPPVDQRENRHQIIELDFGKEMES